MAEELEIPEEGFVTISIAFLKEGMNKAIQTARKLHAAGNGEAQVLAALKKEQRDFSSSTLKRLYDIAVGRPVPDDLTDFEVVSSRVVAKDTLELEFKQPRRDLFPGAVVRYIGTDWYVTRLQPRVEIRRIL